MGMALPYPILAPLFLSNFVAEISNNKHFIRPWESDFFTLLKLNNPQISFIDKSPFIMQDTSSSKNIR